jgi:YD repeat-containing protein
MQKSSGGSGTGIGKRRRQGVSVTALPLLLAIGVSASACDSDEPMPPAPEAPQLDVPIALGTQRAALLTSTVFEAVGDTFIRSGLPHRNEGSSPQLSVQIGSTHRVITYFDTISIRNAVTDGQLVSAQLEFTIGSIQSDWGPGRMLAVHSMLQTSFEGNATWACASDSSPGNNQPNCSGQTAWNMSGPSETLPYEPQATSTTSISNNQSGTISFDVTSDVAGIAAGTNAGLGWLVKKQNEDLSGTITFISRELGPAPRLRLVVEAPDSCTVTAEQDTDCNGLDDDCDGEVDEDYVSTVTSCGVGACVAGGTTLCSVGVVEDTCQPGEPGLDDTSCNGVDDDCDGEADEGFIGSPTSCGVGACEATGATSCASGQLLDSCQPGSPASSDATCDGVDEDCDGVVDDDYTPSSTTCGVGACAATGTTTCVVGAVLDSCQEGQPAASDLTCDGADDDCDGAADEDYAPIATSCGIGACVSEGATSCASGIVVDGCAPGTPAISDATCDGTDDDCDGIADEDFAPTCAGTVARTCVSGGFHDVQCSDGDACNGAETCGGFAECQPGTPPELDDQNPCTQDRCVPATGVEHALLAEGTACGAYRACSEIGECRSLLPSDPSDIAPELPSGPVSFLDSVRFIFDGDTPIQTGVGPSTLSERTSAAVRGRLLDEADQPLPGAVVRVPGHPELGQTLTRFDGEYDLVVNGSPALTLEFEHSGYIAAQRTLDVPWNDHVFVDDVALVPPDSLSAELDFPSPARQIHRATIVDDARGVRAAALHVPAGTEAELVLVDGTSLPLPTLTLRATEFVATANATLRLPAELPDATAHGYALEVSADEADVEGALRVELSQAAHLYVENFLELPVGSSVPLGAYDRAQRQWAGLSDGRILEVLSTSAGVAALDIEGGGNVASESELSAIGIGPEELQAIAELYTPGTSFWRASVQHLAPFELGFPYRTGLGSGGTLPAAPAAQEAGGSDVLTASVAVPGTALALRYRSDRVPGFKVPRILDIPATGSSVSGALLGSRVDVRISGQRYLFDVDPTPGSFVHFIWDGLDGEGRPVFGQRYADVRVGSIFPKQQVGPSGFESTFAHTSASGPAFQSLGDADVRWQEYRRPIGNVDGRGLGVGAWSFEHHHYFDPVGRVLYRGDGAQVPMASRSIIDRFAGVSGKGSDTGDGGLALDAGLNSPRAVAVGPDGALYIGGRMGVRRVDPKTNVITTVAGGKDQTRCNPNLQNGSALDMCLFVRKIDFGRDGALYITDNPTAIGTIDRLRRLDLSTGRIRHVAGASGACSQNNGDGGPAESARICNLISHASGPDGSIYLLDRGTASVAPALRKISPNGIIETIGTGSWGSSDDSADIAVGPDGSLFVTQPRIIERIFPTGELQVFAGNPGNTGSSGEGGPATSARFGSGGPSGVMVDAQGRVYVGDNGNGQLRMVDQQGIIWRVAGTTPGTPSGNGGAPLQAGLGPDVLRTALSPDGMLYIATRSNHTVRVIRPAVVADAMGDFRVRSDDGTQTYRFDSRGRHLDTIEVASGQVLHAFGYDAAGQLATITGSGQTTEVERDDEGRPLRIVSPDGAVLLDTDDNGFLSKLIGPTGVEATFEYDAGGLLLHRVNFDGSSNTHAYDADGRLSAP